MALLVYETVMYFWSKTVVAPIGKALPEGGTHSTAGSASQISVTTGSLKWTTTGSVPFDTTAPQITPPADVAGRFVDGSRDWESRASRRGLPGC